MPACCWQGALPEGGEGGRGRLGQRGWGTGQAGTEAHFLVLLWQILSSGSEMMGLGSGRRSMKSPPLLLAALVACVIVLGFNYWIASSRSVDLQVFSLFLCLLPPKSPCACARCSAG